MKHFANIEDLILHSLHTSLKSSAKFQAQAPIIPIQTEISRPCFFKIIMNCLPSQQM